MRRKTMLLTATALTTLTYCSDNAPRCLGFCVADASSDGRGGAVFDAPPGFWPPDAAVDAPSDGPTDAPSDVADE